MLFLKLHKSITQLVWQFISGNFLSKISGLLRDVSMAFFYGADAYIAAFIVAYRMANLLRRLFGEGALVTGFIPHFESLKIDGEKKAFEFFRDVSVTMSLILCLIVVIFEGGVFWLKKSNCVSEGTFFIFEMTAIMFPSILFICLFGIYSAVLQSYKKFFHSSIAPVFFNTSWIIVMCLSKHLDRHSAMRYLSLGVLLGFIFQYFFVAYKVFRVSSRHLSLKDWMEAKPFSKFIKPIFVPLLAGVVGVGANQINNALDVIFARIATLEGPAYLTYGIRIQQLPLSVFVIALSSVILPQLSRLIKMNQIEEFKMTLQGSLYRAVFMLVPITLICFLLGGSMVNLIYGRGHFDQIATIETTRCLWAYSIGLLPMGLVILLAPAFFAHKDYKVTTIASVVTVIVNICLNLILIEIYKLGAISVAYATSVAAFVNMAILALFLRKKIGAFVTKEFFSQSGKVFLISLLSGLIVFTIDGVLLDRPSAQLLFETKVIFPRSLYSQFFEFLSGFFVFTTSFLLLGKLLKVQGLMSVKLKKFIQFT